MIYLIDGHNLIAQMPGITLGDPNDEAHLVLRLRSWAAVDKKRKIVLIFDKGMPAGKSKNLSTPNIQVRFAPHKTTADRLLIQRINRTKNPREFILVTGDRMIIAAAQARKMPHTTSKKFVADMKVDKRPPPPSREVDNPKVSKNDVDEWLTLFGPTKPRPKREAPSPRLPIHHAQPEEAETKPAPTLRTTTRDDYKQGRTKIDEDELKEWLELFGDGN